MWIFYIIVIIVLISFNNRLSRLEKMTKTGSLTSFEPKRAENSENSNINITPVVTPASNISNQPVSKSIENSAEPVSSEESYGKLLGTIGVIAVFFGVGFFLKYAFDNNWIGPAGRVMIGVVAGVGLIGLGQFLRAKYLQYSDFLIGGGIAILYLSVYSANVYYHLITPLMSGVFMFAVTILAFAISIVNATEVLGILAVAGGFLTPTLSEIRENNMIILFGYMTILNAGVLGISLFKHWRKLLLVSFAGTIINFLVWKSMYYDESLLLPTLAFLLISFLIFLIANITRAGESGMKASRSDFLLLGANAFMFSILFYELLSVNHHNVIGFSSVLLAIIYMGVAYIANKANPDDHALNIFLPGVAVTFLSIAVPMQLDGPYIAIAWLVESCVLYYIASIISNRGFQIMGAVVYVLGGVDFIFWQWSQLLRSGTNDFTPVFNMEFAVMVVGILAAYAISYMYYRFGSVTEQLRQRGITVFVIVANIVTIYACTTQINYFYDQKTIQAYEEFSQQRENDNLYSSQNYLDQISQPYNDVYYQKTASLRNQNNTIVSIFWALYAALLTAIGFVKRFAGPRRFGLVLFVVTGLKVLLDVWNLGEIYRIISFVIFGVIALCASFAYAKYKDRLKAIIVLALIFLSGITFSSVSALDNQSGWQYTRKISITSNGDYSKIILPENISKTFSDLRDIRIINQSGVEVPYVVSRNVTTEGGVIEAKIFNNTTVSGQTQFIVDNGKNGLVSTRIDIETNSPNFKRQVSVYASNDLLPLSSPSWALVTNEGYIFKFTDNVTGFSSGKSYVDFSANTSRYYKIVISSGGEGAVDVYGARVYGDISKTTPTYTKNYANKIQENTFKKTTEVILDLGDSGILYHAVNLNPISKNYSRKVVVEVSDDATNWGYVSQGYISSVVTSLFTGSSNRLVFPEQRTRYIKLSVVNDDNQPLVFDGHATVEGPVLYAIFESKLGESYSLYYGNSNARKPVYDISRISAYINENSIPVSSLSVESINPGYEAPKAPVIPITEVYPWLLNFVLILVVVILLFAVGVYLMKYRRQNSNLNNNFENRP